MFVNEEYNIQANCKEVGFKTGGSYGFMAIMLALNSACNMV